METMKIACKKCGVSEIIGGIDRYGHVYGDYAPAAFLTVHLNGCHQAEVESGNPPMLADIFEIKGESDG